MTKPLRSTMHPLPQLIAAGFSWEYPGFYARGNWQVGTPEYNDGEWVCQHVMEEGGQPTERSFDTTDIADVISRAKD